MFRCPVLSKTGSSQLIRQVTWYGFHPHSPPVPLVFRVFTISPNSPLSHTTLQSSSVKVSKSVTISKSM